MIHSLLTLLMFAPIGVSCSDLSKIINRIQINETVTLEQKRELIETLNESFPKCTNVETKDGNY
jgi:hypothetical protein